MLRERPYAQVEKQAFLRDVIGLANALVDGPRYLILGVRDQGPDQRKFVGMTDAEIAEARKVYQALILKYVEPDLAIDFNALNLDGNAVAILSLNQCDEPPYLLKEDLANSMREGSGWIYREQAPRRLRRADLRMLFEKTLFGPAHQPKIQVGFVGKSLVEELVLDVLDLTEMPSKVAGGKFRKLMEAKQAAQDVGARTLTHIQRLVHVREFGAAQPYESVSDTSLKRRVNSAEEEHYWADDYYEFETRAHKVNLALKNLGEVALRDGQLTLEFPHVEGFGISEYLRTAKDDEEKKPVEYPKVDAGEKTIRVQVAVRAVPGGAAVPAFVEPLRIWARESAAGQTLPVDFRLIGSGLREPVTGTLRIRIQ
ncbi:MAG: AlbA family DNA-binding domain-containing protein [Gammaproteobacteria bacterium]